VVKIKKFLKIVVLLTLIIMSIVVAFIGNGYKMYKEAIEEISIEDKIKQIKSKENYTEISELPQTYIDAVLSVEDHRFYKHNGIDIIAIGRAIVNDIRKMEFIEGGSTITQQLAKNIYFTQEKKVKRKIAEVFMAFKIEKNYKKDEILELYINTICFGNGYYTIKEAVNGYFNKEPKEMTDCECILLAGIPNAPSIYANNLELLKQRQKQVLNKMLKYKYLTQDKANEILNQRK
jgi:monofunctional glycosyltransferase